ncbi:MAG: iron-containing alcohol dehydrogenase [Candidatus Glassbacteria bacterium]
MVVPSFEFTRTPEIRFAPGIYNDLGRIIGEFGSTVLVVTGESSLARAGKMDVLVKDFRNRSIDFFHLIVHGEPTPDLVDEAVSKFGKKQIDVVLSIGGGSAIDAGKAISAMLHKDSSVFDFLEGVGSGKEHDGVKVPFIAVPTTSGTGSEATKNAVLSRVGAGGFKRSLRHDNLVPDVAVIDPELMLSCPPDITAVCGMDAFTQLLESYVSTKSTPITDALSLSGLVHIKDNLLQACMTGANQIEVRAGMAYASLLSGITLANAGLGIVHGFASSIGGLFHIPHGIVCGTLMGPANDVTINAIKSGNEKSKLYLEKYAKVGALLSGCDPKDIDLCCKRLIETIYEWTEKLEIPLLSDYGIRTSDIDRIIEETGNKNNPVKLDREGMKEILSRRILS